MDAFDNKCCDKNTWNVTFTVLSSIGATAAAILTVATEGAAAPLLLQVVGAAAQIGATLPPDSLSDPPKGGGETALQIIDSMRAAIDQLTQVVQKAEAVIAEKTTAVAKLVDDHGSYFVSARPARRHPGPGSSTRYRHRGRTAQSDGNHDHVRRKRLRVRRRTWAGALTRRAGTSGLRGLAAAVPGGDRRVRPRHHTERRTGPRVPR
jgi:hypothetical protein